MRWRLLHRGLLHIVVGNRVTVLRLVFWHEQNCSVDNRDKLKMQLTGKEKWQVSTSQVQVATRK